MPKFEVNTFAGLDKPGAPEEANAQDQADVPDAPAK